MIGNIKKLYRGFYNILASHSFAPVHQCTNLLIDLLKNDDPDTEIHFSKLIPILIQNLGSTKIPICTATLNCLKAYSKKIGGLPAAQLRPGIVMENLYLGVEANKNNLDNIKEYLYMLESSNTFTQPQDQLEQELYKQASGVSKWFKFYFLEEANLASFSRGNVMRSPNLSIDSASNSIMDENAYNYKKRWMHDNKEFSGVGKSILGISENHNDPYGSGHMGETGYSRMSGKTMNSIAYGPDGLAFGVVPKEILDQIEEAGDDWNIKNMAVESIFEIVQETSSLKIIASYAPSFLRYL
jgi:hypothetical protein